MCSLSSIPPPPQHLPGSLQGQWKGGGVAGRIKGERKIVKPFNCCIISTVCSLSYYFRAFHVSVLLEGYFSLGPVNLCHLDLSHLRSGGEISPPPPSTPAQAVVWLCLLASLRRESSPRSCHLGRRGQVQALLLIPSSSSRTLSRNPSRRQTGKTLPCTRHLLSAPAVRVSHRCWEIQNQR